MGFEFVGLHKKGILSVKLFVICKHNPGRGTPSPNHKAPGYYSIIKYKKIKISLIQIFLYLLNILLFPVPSYSSCWHHKLWRWSKKMDAKSINWKVICTCMGCWYHYHLWYPSLDMLQLWCWWFSHLVVSHSCNPMDRSLPDFSVHRIFQARKQVGRHFLFQGIFPTQGSNLDPLHYRQILYQLSYQGSPCYSSNVLYIIIYYMLLSI